MPDTFDAAAHDLHVERVATALGRRVVRDRLLRGLSLSDLAARTGLSRTYLSRLRRPGANPSLDVLLRVATALDTSVAELLLEHDDDSVAAHVIRLELDLADARALLREVEATAHNLEIDAMRVLRRTSRSAKEEAPDA